MNISIPRICYYRMQELFKEKPKEPKRIPVGKLKVAMGHKVLESDPDSKLPWELLASDSKSEGANTASKTKRGSLKPVEELKIISGVPKLTSVEAEVHSSSSGDKEEVRHLLYVCQLLRYLFILHVHYVGHKPCMHGL